MENREHFGARLKKYLNIRYQREPIGGIGYGGTSSISANVGQGMGTMATLDDIIDRTEQTF